MTVALPPILGVWMRLRSPEDLAAALRHQRDLAEQGRPHGPTTPRQLAEMVGKSRQFIYLLLGDKRQTCKPETAAAIELALGERPGALFAPHATHGPRPERAEPGGFEYRPARKTPRRGGRDGGHGPESPDPR